MKMINDLQKSNPLNLSTLIKLELTKLVTGRLFDIPNNHLPETIGEYHLIEKLKKQRREDTNRLGIYKSNTGQKAFGKMLNYGYKNIEYLKLKNEINLYKIINNYWSKSTESKNFIFENYRIPEYIASKETKNSLLILVEFIDGIRGDRLTSQKKVKVYLKNMELLKELGKKLSETEKEIFSKRTAFDYIVLYPYLLIMALIRNPNSKNNLIKGIPVFLKNLHLLFMQDELIMSHRDLHFKNVIVNKTENVLIDFESCGFTLPLYDVVTTLMYEWRDFTFAKKLIETIENSYDNNKFENYLKLLIVIVSTHGLTASNYSKREIHQIEEFLSFGINYRSNSKKQIVGANV